MAKFDVEATFGAITAHCQADDAKELFEGVATLHMVLQYQTCGKCGADAHQHIFVGDKGKSYTVQCSKCPYVIQYGQRQGTEELFCYDTKGWHLPDWKKAKTQGADF